MRQKRLRRRNSRPGSKVDFIDSCGNQITLNEFTEAEDICSLHGKHCLLQ